MFTGFERGAFEFFMALQFNNNREFFHSNHAWYQASVRGPLSALCMDLAPGMLALDGELAFPRDIAYQPRPAVFA